MDVTRVELVGRTNWRRQEKTQNVGEWKARVYEMHSVVFSFRLRKVAGGRESDVAGREQVLPVELVEDDDGFFVWENPSFGMPLTATEKSRHSSFVRQEKKRGLPSMAAPLPRRSSASVRMAAAPPTQAKEKEYVRSLLPSVALTEQFPLKTEELLPLLDILANKVVIPVVPIVRVVITFTKFVELQPVEQFYTPFSSPRHLLSEDDEQKTESHYSSFSSSLSSAAK